MRATLFISIVLGFVHLARADDWPQFLGPQRDGISAETGLLDAWPEGGPSVLWRVPGGTGMSGLSIVGARVVTLFERDAKQLVVSLAVADGAEQWATAIAPAYRNDMGNGPRATPAIADGVVHAFSGEGVLVALSLEGGEILWRHDTLKDLDGKCADYGMASSPLVAGANVVVTVGAPGACVVAFDRKTGAIAWRAGGDRAGYSSAALRKLGGREQLVVFTGESVLGLDPGDGRVLWRHPFATEYDCNIATPLAHEGKLFISSGENHGCALLSFTPGEGGAFEVTESWTSLGPKSVLRNEWQTSLLIDGRLHGFDNVGSAGPVTHFTCVEIDSGKTVWQELRFGKGNAIAADGKIFASTMKGELVILRASPERFTELGRSPILGATRQAPALADGRLFLRDAREIVCVDVRRPSSRDTPRDGSEKPRAPSERGEP